MVSSVAQSHSVPTLMKVLADSTRIRAIALLALEELSVGELARCLGMAQSRVSNHLRVLRDHDLLDERRVGTSTYLRSATVSAGASSALGRLWTALEPDMVDLPEHEADRLRLGGVMAERQGDERAFFDRMAEDWDKVGARFERGTARERATAHLLGPGKVFADLGCGTGYVARSLAGVSDRLICVDRSEGMLQEARLRLRDITPDRTSVEFRQGELDALPIADAELDGAVAAMVLHHLPELTPAVREMLRVLKPGGTLSIVELMPHHEAWMHQELGDRHLGLAPSTIQQALTRAGFIDVIVEPLEDRYCPQPGSDGPLDAEDRAAHPRGSVALPLYLVRGRAPQS